MAGALLVPSVEPEARDRAVHDPFRHVVRADPEPLRDARPEALEHDVRARAERLRERGVGLQVADDRLDSRRASAASQAGAVSRIGSPPGASTRTTRAPSRRSSRLAYAPGR